MADPKLQVEITAETRGFAAGIAQAQARMKGFASEINGVSKGISDSFSAIRAPILAIAGLVGGGAFLKSTVTETVNWTVEANKLAKTLGITTQEASVLNLAIGDIYGTMDEFLPLVGKITKTLNTNEDAFRRLGVKTRDDLNGNLRSTPSIIADVNSKLASMKAGTDRNIASTQIYGKGWMDVQRYLGLTSEVMQAAQDKAEKLNLMVGPEAVSKVSAYRASINDLEDTVKALKIGIGSELMPVLTAFNNDMQENGPAAVGALSKAFYGVYQMVYALREMMEIYLAFMGNVWDTLVSRALSASKILKSVATFDLKGAMDAEKAFQSESLRRNQRFLDEKREIQEKYARKTIDLMGIGPINRKKDAGGGNRADTDWNRAKAKENQYAEELAKLAESRLKHRPQETLNQKELLELEQAEVELAKQLDTYEKQRTEGKLSAQQFLDLSTQAKENAERAKLDIETKYNGLRLTEAEKIWKIREESEQKQNEILANMEDAKLQHDFEMGRISADKLLQLRVEMEEARFQVALKALEERKGLTDEEQAHIDSEIQQLKLKHREANQSLAFQQEGASAQTNFGDGIRSYITKSRQELKQWGTFAQNLMQGVQQSFATGIKGILSGNMSLGEGLKTIWQGIADTIINALAQMAAQWLTTMIAEAIFGKVTANTAQVKAAASQTAAAAGIFEAHASIPWVGPLYAAAMVAMMQGVLMSNAAQAQSTIVANAQGSLVTRPTLALIGEKGENEVVAPETIFKSWAGNLTRNILAQERQVQDYRMQAAGYSRMASAQGSRNVADGRPFAGGVSIDNRGATFIGTNDRQWSDMVMRGVRRHEGKFS